jgi:hypothetical protein
MSTKEGPGWSPLPMIVHGKVIKSFLPLDKYPELNLSAFYKNLYYGDEVFLFESNSSNWARGYQIVQPLPADFIAKSSDLDKLPELQVSVVIVPFNHIHVLDRLPIISNFSPPAQGDFDNGSSKILSAYELQLAKANARNGELVDETPNVRLKPPLPLIRLDTGDLLDEMVPSLCQLGSHIYSLYSVAEYPLFEKLYKLFEDIHNMMIQMRHNLLTKNEKMVAKKKISLYLTNIAKILSSKGVNRFEKASKSKQLKNDTSGFESIPTRDTESGELYDYFNKDLAKQPLPNLIAANQIAAALQPNFPVKSNLEVELQPKRINKFDKVTPSQILVDFKDVSGTSQLNPKGFIGMTAYMYLRSAKKRLTEAFSIHIGNPADFSLDKISAALFRNIPGTEIDNGRIYLVAIITEELEIQTKTAGNHPSKMRNGIAAGVADISRIFSRHKGALETGQAHQFIIKLFGSYVNKSDNTTLDPRNMNFGWGELIDRVIAGSTKGVAVNPRAERLIVSIKEFRDDLANVALDFDANIKTPIYQIRTNFFDPLVKAYDRIYFSLGKVNLTHNGSPFPGDLVSITLINDNPSSKIGISKATNEVPVKFWDFTTVHSNEVVGETIKISNIEGIAPNETLKLKMYVNCEFRAEAEIQISQNGKIYEYHKNQILNFTNGKSVEGSVEVTTTYIGKTYNIDSTFQHVLGWRRLYALPDHEERLIEALKLLNQTAPQQAIKYFHELAVELLNLFDTAASLKLTKLKAASFYSFIHLFDIVVARQEQYTYLYHDFVDALSSNENLVPACGPDLLFMTASYFNKADTEWNYVGRTLSRIFPLLIKISLLTNRDQDTKELKSSWNALSQTLTPFVQLKKEPMIPDQLNVLECLDITLNHLKCILSEAEIINYAIAVIDAVGTRGLIAEDNASLIAKEKQIYLTKLFLIRRLLDGWPFTKSTYSEPSEKLFFAASRWTVEAFSSSTVELEILRLANSCLISLSSISWKVIVDGEISNYVIPRSMSRMILTISKLFVQIHQYCRNSHLFDPKRSYTNIFPNTYPFPDLITDSIVNDVVIVEVLIELAVVYCFVTKIGKSVASFQGYISIIDDSYNDSIFNGSPNFVSSFSKDDLLSIIQTNRLLVQSKFFPREKWISLYALFIEGATSASELIKFVMIRDNIPSAAHSDEFDRSLWSKYLKSLLAMGGSMPASICHLAEVPRKASWKITQDIRTRCASVLNQVWESLGWDSLKRDFVRFEMKRTGGYHAEFIQDDYGILEELSVFCLQRNSYCQIVGVKVLWSIMISELLVQESSEEPLQNKLIEVERGCLLGLDRFFKAGNYFPGPYEQKNFITRLKMAVRLDAEDESFPDVYNFIQNLSDFLDVQNDFNSVPNGEEYDDERTFHDLDILRHLMRVNNAKKFNSSLDEMYEKNLAKSNFVQAAVCLELMASTYDWDVDHILPVSIKPSFPSQPAFERKEALYKLIAENLFRGRKLEKAVLIYKELAEAYDKINFNLKGLSFVHNQLGKLYLQLEALDRETPTYFMVAFLGLGFPKTVRSRRFIYEGLPFEQISSIHNRLLRLHTGAKIISDEEALRAMEHPPSGKFLNIVAVKPHMDFSAHHGNLSSAARLYMQNKDLKYFTTSRRLQKSTSVLDLWVEEITYETYNVFPTLMNRSEVYEVHINKLSPIQNALRTLTAKTQDLVNAESAASKALKSGDIKSSVFNQLSRNLSGTVDSPVNGGIAQYREFFNQKVDPEDEVAQNEQALLKSAFDNLSICVYRCLLVHGKMVPDSLRESHIVLIQMFEKNFSDEISRTRLSISDLEEAIPSPALSKVPSSTSTLQTQTTSTSNGYRNASASTATSMINSLTHGLTRTDTKSSDTTTTTAATNGSNGKKRSLLNWRQSRQPE